MMLNIHSIIEDAITELQERLKERVSNDCIGDIIHEVADWQVPIYNSQLLEIALNDLPLACVTPELWPAFNGDNTPINLIAANIYESIIEELWKWYHGNND